jgi:hypothetical protein
MFRTLGPNGARPVRIHVLYLEANVRSAAAEPAITDLTWYSIRGIEPDGRGFPKLEARLRASSGPGCDHTGNEADSIA